jgi:hypothetical protein
MIALKQDLEPREVEKSHNTEPFGSIIFQLKRSTLLDCHWDWSLSRKDRRSYLVHSQLQVLVRRGQLTHIYNKHSDGTRDPTPRYDVQRELAARASIPFSLNAPARAASSEGPVIAEE